MEEIQFHENFAWFCANTCDVVCEEDLKHFHTFLLGNEEDAKGLLNIKQEFYRIIYCTLKWQECGKWFHLKRGGLVVNGYQPC